MSVVIQAGQVALDLAIPPTDDRLVGFWAGPTVAAGPDQSDALRRRFAAALASPRDFPPLQQAVVPGDRVALALDLPEVEARAALTELARVLGEVGVETITAVATRPAPRDLPAGVAWVVHDPDDRAGIAYLASTKEGRRVYLNRELTDADFVLPIGTLGFDRALGYGGPWSALYPGLSDREALTRYHATATATVTAETATDAGEPPPALAESAEVGWLIGCQLAVGVLPDSVLAGSEALVRAEGSAAVDRLWTFAVAERADLVIVGVGPGPDSGAPVGPVSLADLGAALASATSLVRRGGRIVALAAVDGPLGPALQRLSGVDNPKTALNRLRGHEADPDFAVARHLATALAWADVYLLSGWDADTVEDLGIIPLTRPEEIRKLAASAPSLTVVNRAESTRCIVRDDG